MTEPVNGVRGVAVVGLACRFPGAADAGELWRNLRDGVETIRRLSAEDLAEAGVPPALAGTPGYVRAASSVDGVELFDASFFDIHPREAEILDPQQRLYLECAWHAFESAGYDCRNFPGRIGVYAGSRISDYFLYHLLANPELLDTVGQLPLLFGNDKDYLSTFTSYKLDLRGPSVSVQTACSSSLVAVHLACESLLNGECDMALAGG
ncbi:MAG TPA: polyketide synthase, partial [Thermoanaerobaculia bacterium]|nr:polyketide synthase [Thermoanaerobaculia bacterium]